MRKLAIVPAALAALAIACGGGSEAEPSTVLRMRGFDMESNLYRAHVRGTFAANAGGAEIICRDVAPMNEAEAQAYLAPKPATQPLAAAIPHRASACASRLSVHTVKPYRSKLKAKSNSSASRVKGRHRLRTVVALSFWE